jgi:hypothetical protein
VTTEESDSLWGYFHLAFQKWKLEFVSFARGLNDLGEDQNHPDYQDDIEDHSNVKKYVEESAVSKFIV